MRDDAAEALTTYVEAQQEIRSRSDQAWARYLARSFDVLLLTPVTVIVYLVATLPLVDVLPPWAQSAIGMAVIETLAGLVAILLVEPLVVAATGTTPGKWLMGIRIRRLDGGKPGYFAAVGRTAYVMIFGFAVGLPILSFVAAVLGRGQLLTNGTTIWERLSEGFAHHRRRSVWVWAPMFFFVIACNVALAVLAQQA